MIFCSQKEEKKKYYNEVIQNGSKVFDYSFRFHNILLYIYKIYKLFKYEKYDVIHIHGNSATIFLEGFIAKIAGIKKIIGHGHNSSNKYKIIHLIFKPFVKLVLNFIIAGNDSIALHVFGTLKYNKILNGVDPHIFLFNQDTKQNLRNKYKLESNEKVFLHAGAFNKQKNQVFLIYLFKHYFKTNPNCKLFLLGEGENKEIIYSLAKDLNLLHSVYFVGNVIDVYEYYSLADILLFPSLFEGLSMVLIESQFSGLPIIVSEFVPNDLLLSDNYFKCEVIKDDSYDIWSDKINYFFNNYPVRSREINSNMQSFNLAYTSKEISHIYDR